MPDLPTKYRIGRRNDKTHRLDYAFYIERTEHGGIRITKIAHKLTERERRKLFAHFGIPHDGHTGGFENNKLVTRVTTEQPGTRAHFVRASKSIPHPFRVMAENYEKYLR